MGRMQVGATIEDVVRTRLFVRNMQRDGECISKAHGEVGGWVGGRSVGRPAGRQAGWVLSIHARLGRVWHLLCCACGMRTASPRRPPIRPACLPAMTEACRLPPLTAARLLRAAGTA